jgi:hypothetical protein
MRPFILISILFAGALLAGCSMDSTRPMTSAPQGTAGVAVSPADGATAVRLDAAVTLAFAAPVDRAVVERDFHLISEAALADPTCPAAATMSHPDMAHCMADSVMMRHLDAYHATPGRFTWNAAGTVCAFQPIERMAPVTRQMVHMDREMTDMLGGGMDGMMDRHGSGSMSRHMMFHFTTMDTTGGHGGHH